MEPQIEPRTVERRRIARQKSFLRGSIYFNSRSSVHDCLIRDISPYGARLIFSVTVAIPDTLELHIPQKERSLRAHVIWRHGREVGVAFAQLMDFEQPDSHLAERVGRLESEVAALKRELKRLKADGKLDGVHEFDVA